jgi:hypothetical protein
MTCSCLTDWAGLRAVCERGRNGACWRWREPYTGPISLLGRLGGLEDWRGCLCLLIILFYFILFLWIKQSLTPPPRPIVRTRPRILTFPLRGGGRSVHCPISPHIHHDHERVGGARKARESIVVAKVVKAVKSTNPEVAQRPWCSNQYK